MRSLFWSLDCRKKEGQGIYVEERAWELEMKFNSKRYIVNTRGRREKLRKELLEIEESDDML